MLFGPRRDETRSAAIRALKETARTLFKANDDDVVSVNELSCTEPGCPPIETVIILLRAGSQPRQVKVHKPAVDVTEDELRSVIDGSDHHDHRRV